MSVTYPNSYYVLVGGGVEIAPTVSNPSLVDSYASTTIPDELSINTESGEITGTASLNGIYEVIINTTLLDTTVIVNTIIIGMIYIDYSDLYYGVITTSISYGPQDTFTSTPDFGGNFVELHDFSISPPLSAGFSINALNGVISGEPTEVGINTSYEISFKAPDNTVFTTNTNLYGFQVIYQSVYNPVINQTVNISPHIIANFPLNSFNVYPGINGDGDVLPDGLSLNTTNGIISGTPTQVYPGNNAIFIEYGIGENIIYYTSLLMLVTTVSYGLTIDTLYPNETYTFIPTISNLLDEDIPTNYRFLGDISGFSINPNTGVITVTSTDYFTYSSLISITVQFDTINPNNTTYFMFRLPVPTECLAGSTRILTTNGYKEIKSLTTDDKLIIDTKDIKNIKQLHKITHTGYLYTIPKGIFGFGLPLRDILITGKHKFKYNNKWHKPQKYFQKTKHDNPISLYHIELDDITQNFVAEGIVVESYHPQTIKK